MRGDGREKKYMTKLTVAFHNFPTPLEILPSVLTVHGYVVRGYRK